MKTTAIICEYNPFHNGHKYQIDTAREVTGCDCVVALMSGNYVQRGEFSVFPKEHRAKIAIECGVDLVLENPAYLTMRSAEGYAYSAVYTLNALGNIDYLVFGAECEDIGVLYKLAEFFVNEGEDFKKELSIAMAEGLSFAAAREVAAEKLLGEDISKCLRSPNNLLAVEYLKALIRLKSPIKPVLIKRVGAEHNSLISNGCYASATLVRDKIIKGEDVIDYAPRSITKAYREKPFNNTVADVAIIASLVLKSAENIADTPDISEGLENKIKAELLKVDTLDELITAVKSKRYAYSRIKRALLCAYLGVDKEEAKIYPEYIKILDFNKVGQAVLNSAKKTAILPLAKNAAPLLKLDSAIRQWKRELERDRVYKVFYDRCTEK